MESLFCCPICGAELERGAGEYACPRGHRFDLAREGYVNLLPANRRRSKAPGDDRDMIRARTRFLEGGWYSPLRDALCRLLETLAPHARALLDAGCGEGYYTQALARVMALRGGRTAGIDLSKSAVRHAARLCPEGEIGVASVYHLPMANGAVDTLVDCFSPLAIDEFRRVIEPGGTFFYVVPGPRHLWELKEILYERPYENEEKRERYPGFSQPEVTAVETRFTLERRADIQDLFRMTPYAWKTPREGAARLEELDRLTVTGQFRVHVMRREP